MTPKEELELILLNVCGHARQASEDTERDLIAAIEMSGPGNMLTALLRQMISNEDAYGLTLVISGLNSIVLRRQLEVAEAELAALRATLGPVAID